MRVTCFTFALFLGVAAIGRHAAFGGDHGNSEWERSQATAAHLEREWPLASTGPLAAFMQQLGKQLARAAGPTSYVWQFAVIRDRSANAFAIGGGRIYVSEGTILICQDEAELAAIVAHEMGHELAGHFRPERTVQGQEWRQRLLARLGLGDANATDVTIGSLKQEIDPVKELEADRLSVRILVAAGYDPHASLQIAQRVLGQPAERRIRHFDNARRIAALAQVLAGIPPGGRTDSPEFRRLKQQSADELD